MGDKPTDTDMDPDAVKGVGESTTPGEDVGKQDGTSVDPQKPMEGNMPKPMEGNMPKEPMEGKMPNMPPGDQSG